MFSTMTYLTFIVLISSVGKAVQQDIFCDKTNSLSIDSVLTDFTENELKLSLFIGEDIYDLEPIDNSFESVKVTNRSNLKDMNETLESPIDLSFFTKSHEEFHLWNVRKGLDFVFNRNRTIDSTINLTLNLRPEKNRRVFEAVVLTNEMDGKEYGLRLLFYWFSGKRHEIGIKLVSEPASNDTNKYWLMTRNVGPVKQIKMIKENDPVSNDLTNKVFSHFNGQKITAAFVYQNYWHLFSGRQFCKMKISSDEWLDFCQIKDISDFFFHCRKTTETTKSITTTSMTTSTKSIANWLSTQSTTKVDNSQTIIILIFIGIVVIIGWGITGLVIFIAYKFTQAQRKNQFESGQTTVSHDSMSRVSSVQTIDSGNTKVN